MPITFNQSAVATSQRFLDSSTTAVRTASERLSSGLRINRASDDAAGLAIADTLNNKARVTSQAVRNINDGISLMNIAEAGLAQQGALLDRLQELATQAASGSYTNTQRRALQTEYTQLIAEFGRLGDSLSFNGINPLLAGRGSNSASYGFQVGIDGSGNSVLTIQGAESGSYSGIIAISNDIDGDGLYQFDDVLALAQLGGAGSTFTSEELAGYTLAVIGEENGARIFIGLTESHASVLKENEDGTFTTLGATAISFSTSTGQFTGDAAAGPLTISLAEGFSPVTIDLRGASVAFLTPDFDGPTLSVPAAVDNIFLTGIFTQDRALDALGVLAARKTSL